MFIFGLITMVRKLPVGVWTCHGVKPRVKPTNFKFEFCRFDPLVQRLFCDIVGFIVNGLAHSEKLYTFYFHRDFLIFIRCEVNSD